MKKKNPALSAEALEISSAQSSLISWYKDNHRDLPWRRTKDPYRIWISEIMLQQTTVTAVLPYYDRFLQRFPSLQALANAPVEQVLESWSGLGYYSRARNLHKAAQALQEQKSFPRTAEELRNYPGFGPYTSRAVATFAFQEKVGVLDGNVIRLLSRFYGLPVQHWQPKGRHVLQEKADALAQTDEPDLLNQGLIELGATICSPQNPSCLLCPWAKSCVARRTDQIAKLPLKKPRALFETWLWKPEIHMKNGRIAFVVNDHMPFLKGQWILPGLSQKLEKKPKQFDVKCGVTRFDIYIRISKPQKTKSRDWKWVPLEDVKKVNPTSLIQKVLQQGLP
ncbi:MAG: A/G-specific adenine glycosylase [Bdellovibrionales bacterium]